MSNPEQQDLVKDLVNRQASVDQLIVDVFRLTGQKITSDDPIVVAALFQSSLISRASREAVDALLIASKQVSQEQEKHAASLEATVQGAFQKLSQGAKKITDSELSSASNRFLLSSTQTLETFRDQASKSTPGYLSRTVILVGLVAFAVGASVGAASVMLSKPELTTEQIRLMHNGLLLDAAWPKLNKPSRDAIQPSGQLTGQLAK